MIRWEIKWDAIPSEILSMALVVSRCHVWSCGGEIQLHKKGSTILTEAQINRAPLSKKIKPHLIMIDDSDAMCRVKWKRRMSRGSDLPMDGERINDHRDAARGSHLAYSLNQYKVHYCLLVGQPWVYGDIKKIGLNRNIRGHGTVEGRDDLWGLKLVT